MLGVSSYDQAYIDHCREQIAQQLAAYDAVKAAANGANAQFAAFEPVFFNNLVHVLDNLFVHRLRKLEGKDANPLKEVRARCAAALNGDAPPEIDEEGFRRLSDGFFAEIEAKFAA
jgi:hypothetical protein